MQTLRAWRKIIFCMWLKKPFYLPSFVKFRLLLLNNKVFSLFQTKEKTTFFLELPHGVSIDFTKNIMVINKNVKQIRWRRFFKLLASTLTVARAPVSCQIRVRGAGLGVFMPTQSVLEFRLGQNVRVLLNIPQQISVVLLKKILLIESSSRMLLGNFAASILQLTRQNFFTGRGFWLKNETVVLRPIKK